MVADAKLPFQFLGGEFRADGYQLPSQPKQLHTLVVLLLNAGRRVSAKTLREAVWTPDDDAYWGGGTALPTAISRLRGSGWPIELGNYRLGIDSSEVDILAFDAAARRFILEAQSPRRAEDAALLLKRGRDIASAWEYDPWHFFGDAPVNDLFQPFAERRDELLQALQSLASFEAKHGSTRPDASVSGTDLARYLRDVSKRGMTLGFGNLSSWDSELNGEEMVTLDDLWTPLRVADSQQRAGNAGTHESMTEHGDGSDLLDIVDEATESLVILGDPGSGKSTSAAMLAARAARGAMNGDPVIPIWVNLGTIVPNPKWSAEKVLISGVPEIELAVARQGEHAGVDLTLLLEKALLDGDALLILDGLDEVKDFSLKTVREAITTVLTERNGSRIVISCRTFDYRHGDPSRKLPVRRELEILPLTQDDKLDYVTRWYDSAARAGWFRVDLAEKLRDALQQEITGSAVIAEMAGLPLLLAILSLIHSRQELPDSRSVVCQMAIKFMLAETPPWREREPGSSGEASGPIIRLAEEVAFRWHLAEEATNGGNEWLTHELILQEATSIVESLHQAGASRAAPSPEALTKQFESSHGLLLEAGPARFKFSHRYFQEYLAGQHFSRGRDREIAVRVGHGIHWREPFRLMASYAGHNGDNLYYILQLIADLLESDGVGAQHLASEMLVEITPPRLALWSHDHVLEDNAAAPHPTGLWARARDKLLGQIECPGLSLAERERCGLALASIGDRRLVAATGSAIPPWTHTVKVSGGTRRLGTDRLDTERVLGAFVAPPRTVQLQDFEIGRYLITNKAFAAFIEDGGYQNGEFWHSRRARGWVTGDPVVLAELRSNWLETVNDHHVKEIRDGEIDQSNLALEAARRTSPRNQPYYWEDSRFNRANQPVVGVNYWEAEAYCAWATAKGHSVGALENESFIALPTEFEWEAASRRIDDDRVYPWGDEWDDERALVATNTLNLRAPATVGVFLEAWPGAPLDMAGNVWEWTSSIYRGYSEEEDVKRHDPDSLAERVVRGSSWYNFAPLAACSARAVDRAYNLFYDVGFRVAVVSANSRLS